MRIPLALIMIFVTLLPLQAQAQRSVPACDADDFTAVYDALVDSGFLNEFTEADTLLRDSVDEDALDRLEDLHRLQSDWWADVVPELPRCAEAQSLAVTFGRFLSEALIGVSLGHSAVQALTAGDVDASSRLLDMAEAHGDALRDLLDEIEDLYPRLDIDA